MKNPRSFLLLALLFIISPLILASSTAAQDEMIIQYASRNDVSGIARVIREGGNIDFRDEKSGQTALMRAILSGQTSAVYYLLKHGARTDVAEKDGYTPMHAAAFQGRAEIAKMLIKHGLDPREMHFDKVREGGRDGGREGGREGEREREGSGGGAAHKHSTITLKQTPNANAVRAHLQSMLGI